MNGSHSEAAGVAQTRGLASPASVVQRHRALLILVGVELVLLYAPTWRWLYERWTLSVWHNAHGLLIPPAVTYFAWQELRGYQAPAAASAWGFAFLLPALALHVLDTGMHTELLSAVSIVIALPGLSLLFLGAGRTRRIAFPLAFALFMIPIPLAITEHLHLVLRQIATVAATFVTPLLGIPVFAHGTTLDLANDTLLVGDGCSGFSTLYASVAVAALTAYTTTDWRRRLLVLVAAAPLAIAANVLRVVLLVVLVHFRGSAILDTWVHPASGMLTFALALPVIFWLGGPAPGRTPAR
jgi:exosortase